MFVMEVESGADVKIPPSLSQDKLPMSFRYYDPIIAFVQEGITPSVK